MPPKEPLFLLDEMTLAYRAYFAFINRPLCNSKGENTREIYEEAGWITDRAFPLSPNWSKLWSC